MPSVGHHAGQVYRQPEVGNDLAGLLAQPHGGAGPCSQRTSPTGRVVPFFEPGQVRRSDPQRSGGSDGGVIVGGTFGFSGASPDEGWRDMDGATATAESWRYMDKATTTAFRAEESIVESGVGRGDHGGGDNGAREEEATAKDHWKDQWKTLAGHLWCSSSVVGPVAQCEASGPVDTPKHLTTPGGEQLRFRRPVGSLEGSGGSPPGCIRESAAKDSTKGFGSVGVESKGFGSYGSKGARDATKVAGGTAYATMPDFGATSTTTTPDFRAASSTTTPGISTIASTDGGPWSSLRLYRSDLPERRGDLLLPFGGELFYPNGWVWSGHRNGNSGRRLVCEQPLPHAASGHVEHFHNLPRLQR